MSHLVNPLLLDDFLDEEPSQSAQGCFQGSDYWEEERRADAVLKAERAVRAEILWLRRSIAHLEEELAEAKKKGHNRVAASIEAQIKRKKNELSNLPPLI